MASLVKQFSGRKRGSGVWQHFHFDEKVNKSRCLVTLPKGKECGVLVATKNPTNLKNHLLKHHKELYKELMEAEDNEKKQQSSDKIIKSGGYYNSITFNSIC